MKSGKVALGVLAGLAIGSILGILFAPDKGKRTRGKIMDSGEDLMDSMKDKFDKLISKGKHKYEEIKREAANTTS
jgi:gas vesicle protein